MFGRFRRCRDPDAEQEVDSAGACWLKSSLLRGSSVDRGGCFDLKVSSPECSVEGHATLVDIFCLFHPNVEHIECFPTNMAQEVVDFSIVST